MKRHRDPSRPSSAYRAGRNPRSTGNMRQPQARRHSSGLDVDTKMAYLPIAIFVTGVVGWGVKNFVAGENTEPSPPAQTAALKSFIGRTAQQRGFSVDAIRGGHASPEGETINLSYGNCTLKNVDMLFTQTGKTYEFDFYEYHIAGDTVSFVSRQDLLQQQHLLGYLAGRLCQGTPVPSIALPRTGLTNS